MKRTVISAICGMVLATGCGGSSLLAQHEDLVAETSVNVPALGKFHTVIYKLWHTAWPKKDYELMAQLVPDIEKHAAEVTKADLPGILRDKKDAWQDGVKKLNEIFAEYKTAVEKKDNEKLLDAAERLHAQYERLVRIIHPAPKQVEDFHAVLYVLYHYYMPNGTLDSVRVAAVKLQEKMDSLNVLKLSKRFEKKQAAFTQARAKLAASVAEFREQAGTDDEKKLKALVEKVHTDYQSLEKVFD